MKIRSCAKNHTFPANIPNIRKDKTRLSISDGRPDGPIRSRLVHFVCVTTLAGTNGRQQLFRRIPLADKDVCSGSQGGSTRLRLSAEGDDH